MMEITMGRMLSEEVTVVAPGAGFAMPGVDAKGDLIHWPVDQDQLAGGMLVLGDQGSGKSNVMGLLMRQIRRALGPDDVMIVFDAYGELEKWSRPGDHVIARDGWNIVEEADGNERMAWRIAAKLIKDEDAADLLSRLLSDGGCADTPSLMRAIEALDGENAAAHRLAEAAQEIIAGHFDGSAGVSMRRFVREGGGRALFIKAEPGDGLEKAVNVMISAAAYYAVKSDRRVYFVLDDFDRLGALTLRAEDAFYCGRNITRIVSAEYLKDMKFMLRRFGTRVLMHTSDRGVREEISNAEGACRCRLSNGDWDIRCTVEEWEAASLKRGEAIVCCNPFTPFRFRFKKNPDKRS